MQDISWGHFPPESDIRGKNAGPNTAGVTFGVIALSLCALAWWSCQLGEVVTGVFLFGSLAGASAWVTYSNLFGSNLRHLGLRVVDAGIEICFAYKVSYGRGDTLVTYHVPWSNVESIESIDLEDVYYHLALTFAPPLIYPRGTLKTLFIDPCTLHPKDKAYANAFAERLMEAKSLAKASQSPNGMPSMA